MNKYLEKLASALAATTVGITAVAGAYLGWKSGKAVANKNQLGKDEAFKTKATGAVLGSYAGAAAGVGLHLKYEGNEKVF